MRSQYSRRINTAKTFSGHGRTQQHFKDECDINRIVKRFSETGIVTHLAHSSPQYGFASAQNFTDAAFIVAEAKSQFEALPAKIRAHFENDPAEYLDAVQDESRHAEFVELGLLPEPLPEPSPEPEDPATGLSETRTEAPDPPEAPETPKEA